MKRIFTVLLSLALCFVMFAACGKSAASSMVATPADASTDAKAPTPEKGVIKLGGLAPITGNFAEYGKGFKISFEAAVAEINAAGGVNGYMLEVIVKDTQGEPVTSSTMATQFAEDEEILAILGDFSSSSCLANTEIIDRYGIVQLSPTCSSPLFAEGSEYNYGINGLTSTEGQFGAKYIVGEYLGAKSVGIIRADNDWSAATVTPFIEQCEREGIKVVVDEKYKQDESDFSSIITKVQSLNPEVLVVLDQGTAVSAIFNACDSVGWDIPRVNVGASTSAQIAQQLTTPGNILTTSPFVFDPSNVELAAWRDMFVEKAGFEPTIHPVAARDCVYLIRQAIENIGDGEVTRDAIKNALHSMEMDGFTGRIIFNPAGDITRRMYNICEINKDLEWVIAKAVNFDPDAF